MLEFICETESVWEKLKNTTKPIVLYGMGNGADKILDWCEANGVKVQGIFASDEFVRYQSFRGMTVVKYQELVEKLGQELLVVIAFASERPEVLAKFKELDQQQECVAPHLSLYAEKETVSMEWLKHNRQELQTVYNHLADDHSRKVFASTLNYKLSGKLSYLWECETERKHDLQELFPWQEQEIYWDLGAYNGDTVQEFLELVDYKFQQVVAVEPDRRNCRKLRAYVEKLENTGVVSAGKISVHEQGIWSHQGTLGFSDKGGRQSTFAGEQKKIVTVDSLDNLLGISSKQTAKPTLPTYIKMDLEGCEKQALQGAKKLLQQQSRPKLFMAAYHYDEDLFRLPLMIWEQNPTYQIFLRKHPYVPAWELNFLCK